MVAKSIGFVGGGRVTRIMIGGWATSEKLPAEIVVSDSDEQVLNRLKEAHPQIDIVLNGNERAAAQGIVFLALHPPAIGVETTIVCRSGQRAVWMSGIFLSLPSGFLR